MAHIIRAALMAAVIGLSTQAYSKPSTVKDAVTTSASGSSEQSITRNDNPIGAFYNPHEDGEPISLRDVFYCEVGANERTDRVGQAVRYIIASALASKVNTDRMFGDDGGQWSVTRQKVEEERSRAASLGIQDSTCWGLATQETMVVTLTGKGWVTTERNFLIFVAEAQRTENPKGSFLYFGIIYSPEEWNKKVQEMLTE